MTTPTLTAVVMVDSQRERGARSLKAVCAQSLDGDLEILLVDLSPPDTPPLPGSEHPAVRVMRIDAAHGHGGRALAAAVREARAPIVAFVEEHVVILEGYAQALVDAHQGPWAAVCGQTEPVGLQSPFAKAVDLLARNHTTRPARRGETNLLRWHNVCYKRASLIRYGDALPLYLGSESLLFRRLRQDGERLFVEPAARYVHPEHVTRATVIWAAFYLARLNAASAVILERPGWLTRAWRAARQLLGAVYWPWVLWKRTRSLADPDQWLPVFYRSLPFVCQYYAVSAVAGAIGALAGKGDSDEQLVLYEINAPRQESPRLAIH